MGTDGEDGAEVGGKVGGECVGGVGTGDVGEALLPHGLVGDPMDISIYGAGVSAGAAGGDTAVVGGAATGVAAGPTISVSSGG